MAVVHQAKTAVPPFEDGRAEKDNAGDHREEAKDEASLQRQSVNEALEVSVVRQDVFLNREKLGEDSKENALVTAEEGETGEERSVGVESHPVPGGIAQSQDSAENPEGNKKQAGDKEEPLRAAQEEETKGAPAVAISAQMRRVCFAPIAVESDG